MPTYNSVIDRADVSDRIPTSISKEIFTAAEENSVVMTLGRQLANIPTKEHRINVINLLPTAYFVSGDTGLKQTTEQKWKGVTMTAEELAVLVPIPDSVADDVDFDIWGEMKPKIAEAIGLAIDLAVLHGTNKPSTWPTAIVTAAAAAGNTIALGTDPLYPAVMGSPGLIALVENSGYMVNGHVSKISMKAKYRGVLDANNRPIFTADPTAKFKYSLDGEPMFFPRNGCMNSSTALQIAGDWHQLVWAIRQDVRYKIFDSGVIQDGSGAIVLNMIQQDCKVMRVVFRLGVALPNPPNRLQSDPIETVGLTRYPFATLTAS